MLGRYVLGFLVVNCWRGVWLLQDVYILPADSNATDDEAGTARQHSAWVSHFVGAGVLAATAHLKSVLAPPGVQANDVAPGTSFLDIINTNWCSAGDIDDGDGVCHGAGTTVVATTAAGTNMMTPV